MPNAIAQSLSRKRSDTIGLMMSGLRNPFFVGLLESAEILASQAGYAVLMEAGHSNEGTYKQHGKLSGWPVDGVIMWAMPHQTAKDFIGTRADHVPIVYVGFERQSTDDVVYFDLYGGAHQSAEHLVSKGYSRIGYVAPWPNHILLPRYVASSDVCSKAGVAIEYILMESHEETQRSGIETAMAIASRPADKRPDAVICHNDVIALGLMHGFRRVGLRIPQDIAIVGFDGIDEGQCEDIPLTTVRCDTHALCKAALDLLALRLRGDEPTAPQHIIIPTKLSVGATT
jgi:LacI family transcriptional regulator